MKAMLMTLSEEEALLCEFYEVPIYFYKDKDTLGHAMGKEFRASLAILDEGFAKEIMKQMKTEDNTVA